MIFQVCSFFDSRLRVYSRPFFVPDLATIPRVVKDVMNQDSDISRHPEDFALFHIGFFCDQTADLEPLEAPVCLAHMHEIGR